MSGLCPDQRCDGIMGFGVWKDLTLPGQIRLESSPKLKGREAIVSGDVQGRGRVHLDWPDTLPSFAGLSSRRWAHSHHANSAASYSTLRLRFNISTVSIKDNIWIFDYLFSSAVRAAISSLVFNVIINACSG